MGREALQTNTTGSNNTALGYNALYANTTASNNTAVGYQAAYSNTTGVAVNAFGYQALYANTTGKGNSAFGGLIAAEYEAALKSNTTGNYNAALGSGALAGNTTGANNTAVGVAALYNNTTGEKNTTLGFQAGYHITTGTNNVLIGNQAGSTSTQDLVTGSNNILIGGARVSPPATTGSQQIVIGTAANVVGKGDNTGFISPNGGGVYQGDNLTTWSTTSDQRLKKNIVDNNVGLDAINSIRVRNFEYRVESEITELPTHCAIQKTGVQLGVIAQELQAILPDCVKTESTGVMSVQSDNLTWYMINAIKQLSAEVESLKSQLKGA
jgi:hypothetical protein